MSSRPRNKPRFRHLWSTASMRLALTFSVIFGLGSALLIVGVDYGLFRFIEAEVRGDLGHQMAIMRDDEARLGGDDLITMLESQARNREARRFLFLVIAKDGRSFSNGLTRQAVNDEGFRRNFATKGRATRWPDQRPNMLVLSHTTPGDTLLAIGRDTQHLDELLGGIRTFALWSVLAALALALIAGLVSGGLFLRRLERFNRAVERVGDGEVSERLPAIGFGREFDDLARGLNRMLERQEAMMSALKSISEGIAHDLRTPLGRLRNRLEDLEAAADDGEKRQTSIELAVQEIAQITSLFESLLALSKLESGALDARMAPLDAAALIERIAEIYRPTIEEAGGRLQMALPGPEAPLPPLRGNQNLLMQALSNLVENALVHADGPPDIRLGAEARQDGIALLVADRGPGIPEAERQKVVKRFYRMERSAKRTGSGIGLAMCDAVAHWHQGALLLSNHHPGLKAELLLPAWREEPAA